MAEPTRASAFRGVRFHVVTGKGGTGKTTFAAALALALAHQGQRVLVAEVEGRQGLARVFDVPALPTLEARILRTAAGGEVVGLAVDAKTALLEYLQIFYRLGRAGGALEKVGAVDFATTIAPGVRDVLLIGRVYEAQRRRVDGKHRGDAEPAFDAVVLDAPPTGRVGRFLGVGAEVAGLAKVGPIRSQADSITDMLRAPTTAVHVTTLLEEMPVQETGDALAELAELGIRLGAVVVNQVREPVLDDRAVATLLAGPRAATDLREGLRSALATTGAPTTDGVLEGLITDATERAKRVEIEQRLTAEVERLGRPILQLPYIDDEVDAAGVRELAEVILDSGMLGPNPEVTG